MTQSHVSTPAQEFARLVEIMATLRGPNGCPWDREQTFQSLSQFVLEEAYEVVDAIERRDEAALREEIGDHIFEGVFLAQIASDLGRFNVADSLAAVGDKVVRRHPHVFQDDGRVHDAGSKDRAPSADAALSRWDSQKAREKRAAGQSGSTLGELPNSLPALLRAYTLGKRAAGVGFDWAKAGDVVDKIEEGVAEWREALAGDQQMDAERDMRTERAEEELGDLLFAIANLSRKLGIEPESALRKANHKLATRFAAMEKRIAGSGRTMSNMTLGELEAEWQRVK
jgi:MazG family protein